MRILNCYKCHKPVTCNHNHVCDCSYEHKCGVSKFTKVVITLVVLTLSVIILSYQNQY